MPAFVSTPSRVSQAEPLKLHCRVFMKMAIVILFCLASLAGASRITLAQIPVAPTGLTAISGTSRVSLSWSAVTGATSYNVYRSDTTGTETALAGGGGVTTTSYLDTSGIVNSSHYYYYKVTAVNASGQSALSAETVAIPLAAPVVTTRIGNNQVTLNWGPVGNAYVYNVSRSMTSNTETSLASGLSGLTYTDTGATNGTQFFYKVTAARYPNESDPSVEVSATASATLPGSPVLTATPTGTQIILSWTPVSGASSYKVKRSTARGNFSAILASPTAANYTDTTPVANTTYYYIVTAVIGSAEGANSNEVVASAPSVVNSSATADAYVEQDTPTTNYGTASLLYGLSNASTARSSYLKFNISSAGGYAGTVKLHLFRGGGASAADTIYAVSDNSWTESAITWNTRPSFGGVLASVTPTANGQWVDFDVTTYVQQAQLAGSSVISFGFSSATTTGTGVSYGSKEFAYAPQLLMTVGAASKPLGLTATAGAGQITLAWNSVPGATSYSVYRSGSTNTEAALVAGLTAPSYINSPLSAGTYFYKVSAFNANGESALSNEASATVIPAPAITSFNPASGAIASTVTITGTGFTGATSVKFNTTAAATFTVVSATSITAKVPAGATTGPISVTTPGGTATSAASYTVVPPPIITSFTPTSGLVGSTVTINGTNFTGATSVKFNATAATTFTVVSATSITVTVPAGATFGRISVTTPGGVSVSAVNFTVLVAPTITSFTPTSGAVGATVTITGTGFTGATSVKFNTLATTYTVVSATSITATVPTGATTGQISITTPGGTAMSSSAFTIVLPPTITGFTPTSGSVGNTVSITGSNFTGATSVNFNTTAATLFTVVSATSITATVPAGATSGKVSVTTAGGTATSAASYTVIVVPTYLSNLSLSTTGVIGGTNISGTVTLNQPAPNGGIVVNLHTSDSSVTAPLSAITIASGALSAPFTLNTANVNTPTVTTVVGDSNGWAQSAMVTVLPTSQSFTITNLSAKPGNSSVVLKWTDLPPGSIQGYKIYRNGIALTTTPWEAATFADTGLTNGTTYQYQISVINIAGQEINQTSPINGAPTSTLSTLNWLTAPVTVTGTSSFSAQLSIGVNSSEYLLLVDGKEASVGGSEPSNTGSMGPVIATLDTTSLSNGPHVVQFVSNDGFTPSATVPISVQVMNTTSNVGIGGFFNPSAHQALPLNITMPANTVTWTTTITDDTNSATIRTWNGTGSNLHLSWDGVGSIIDDVYYTITVVFNDDANNITTVSIPAETVMGNPGGLALVDYISGKEAHDIALASTIKAAFTQLHNTDPNFHGIVLNKYSAGSDIEQRYAKYREIRTWMKDTLIDFYLFGHGRGQQGLNDPRPQRSVWVTANFFPKMPLDGDEFAIVTDDTDRNFVIPSFINGRSYNFVFIDSCFSAGGVDIEGNPNDGDPGNPVLTQWHDAFNIEGSDFGGYGTSLGFNGTNQLNTLDDGTKSPWLLWRQYFWADVSVNGTTVQNAINFATDKTKLDIQYGRVHDTFTYPWESKYGYSRLQQSDYSAYTQLP